LAIEKFRKVCYNISKLIKRGRNASLYLLITATAGETKTKMSDRESQFGKDIKWIDDEEAKRQRDIKSGGPLGKWPSDDEPSEPRAYANQVVENPEDRLIDQIDNGPRIEEEDVDSPVAIHASKEEPTAADFMEDEARKQEQISRAARYASQKELKAAGISPDSLSGKITTIQTSRRAQLSSGEKSNQAYAKSERIGKRSGKRQENNQRINLDAQVRRQQKDNLDQRIGA